MTGSSEPTTFDVFAAALDLPPAERKAWVRAVYGDPARASLVLRLIRHDERTDGFLEHGGRWDVAPLAHEALRSPRGGRALAGLVGAVFAGRYRLDLLLGFGGAGAVYLARDLRRELDVAIKILDATSPRRAEYVRRELASLRRLRIPGVVQLRDEGVENGRGFLVTDVVHGRSFPGCDGTVSWDRARETVLGLLETVARIHARGIVHRDLKPANVLVSTDGRATVLDLGIAAEDARHDATGSPAVVAGTPQYAAPEQMKGAPSHPSMDVFAVGAMVYEALAGEPPRSDDDAATLLTGGTPGPIRPIREARPDLDPRVATMLMAMLAEAPTKRPSIEELLVELGVASTLGRRAVERLGGTASSVASQSDLRALFRGPDRVLHLREDAALALHRRTGGRLDDVAAELDGWRRAGLVHDVDGLLAVSRAALARLGADDLPLRPGSREFGSVDPAGTGAAADFLRDASAHRIAGRLDAAQRVVTDGLAIARHAHAAPHERALLAESVLIALRIGRPAALDAVLYELERSGSAGPGIASLECVARAALLCLRGEGERALLALDDVEPFREPQIERMRVAVRVFAGRSLPLARAEQLVADAAAWAAGSGDPDASAALSGWLGWLRYRQDRYREAAEHHLDLVSRTTDEFARLSARLSAGSALLYVGDWERADRVARDALEQATARRDALSEARAEYLLRAVAYRSGRATTPDLEIVSAADALGVIGVAAQFRLNEAAVAWRAGVPSTAVRLATEAAAAWIDAGQRTRWMLAEALRIASSGGHDAGSSSDVLAAARACPHPGLSVQAAGLIACAVPGQRRACAALIRERSVVRPRSAWDVRLEVLSIAECVAVLEDG